MTTLLETTAMLSLRSPSSFHMRLACSQSSVMGKRICIRIHGFCMTDAIGFPLLPVGVCLESMCYNLGVLRGDERYSRQKKTSR